MFSSLYILLLHYNYNDTYKVSISNFVKCDASVRFFIRQSYVYTSATTHLKNALSGWAAANSILAM